jgi:hypothetical protein
MKVSKLTTATPWALLALLAAIGVAGRLLPHMPNVTPIGALAIWAAIRLPYKWAALIVIGTMLVTDAFLGFYQGFAFTYVALLGAMLIASRLKNDRWFMVGGATIVGAILFFLVTNNTYLYAHSLYPHTFAGMIASYVSALPFFKLSLLGDIGYVALFFTLEYVITAVSQKIQQPNKSVFANKVTKG